MYRMWNGYWFAYVELQKKWFIERTIKIAEDALETREKLGRNMKLLMDLLDYIAETLCFLLGHKDFVSETKVGVIVCVVINMVLLCMLVWV